MRWNGRGELVCPAFAGQSLESRLAAQRSVICAVGLSTRRTSSALDWRVRWGPRWWPTGGWGGRSVVAFSWPGFQLRGGTVSSASTWWQGSSGPMRVSNHPPPIALVVRRA